MRRLLLVFSLIAAASAAAQTTTVSAQTGNNSAACNAPGSPSYCQAGFAGLSDSSSGTYDAAPGNVSSVDVHSLLYGGNTTQMFAYVMPWFCMNATSTASGAGTLCQNHIQVGYNSNDANTVNGQAQDMIRRGLNGAVLDWYGPTLGFYDPVAQKYRDNLNSRCSGPQSCPLLLALMEDQGSFQWSGGPTGNGCPQDGGGVDQTGCILSKLESDMDYMNANYFGASSYLKVDNSPGSTTYMQATPNGKPVVLFFLCEECWTNPSPNWTSVWNQLRTYTNGYNSGAPAMFFIFRNAPAFSHAQSDGGYAWVNWDTSAGPDPYGLYYLNQFYTTATSAVHNNPHLLSFGGGWKGFDDSNAPWVTSPRSMGQQCGQTWLQTIQKANSYYNTGSPLPFFGLVTWNDYEEGTEIETGIDNCLTMKASVAGSVLTWTPTFSSAAGSETTVSSYAVYSSGDGSNLTKLTTVAPGTHSIDLSSFSLANGTYTIYVQAVGQPSIMNQMSNGVSYTAGQTVATTGTITGRVTNISTGGAISGATVSNGTTTTTSNSSGYYTFSNVTPGSYSLKATANGFLSATQSVTTTAGTTSTVNFRLATAGIIAGTVKNSAGSSIYNATVTISGGVIPNTVKKTTNTSGKYSSSWIAVGTYTVTVSKSGYTTQSKSASVVTGQTVTVNFTMH